MGFNGETIWVLMRPYNFFATCSTFLCKDPDLVERLQWYLYDFGWCVCKLCFGWWIFIFFPKMGDRQPLGRWFCQPRDGKNVVHHLIKSERQQFHSYYLDGRKLCPTDVPNHIKRRRKPKLCLGEFRSAKCARIVRNFQEPSCFCFPHLFDDVPIPGRVNL